MYKAKHIKSNRGFTLVELIVAMAITGIVAGAIFTAFQSQQKSYLIQDQVAEMQQNLRAAMDIMVREIRMAGYDPQGSNGFGITDIRPRDKDHNPDVNITGNGAFEFTADFDDNGTVSGGETISYSICDFPILTGGDGINDLGRDIGAGRQPIAENIEAMGFAYAFDADGDGDLDTYNDAGGSQVVIWAIDSDGDNRLDRNLDTDGDGDIDENDGPGPNGIINGTAIANIAPQDIRAVRIWILAKTRLGDRNFTHHNTNTYVVGYKVISPSTDADPNNNNRRMRLLETEVKCRNLEFN